MEGAKSGGEGRRISYPHYRIFAQAGYVSDLRLEPDGKSGLGKGSGTPWQDYINDLVNINKMKYATHLNKLAAFFGKKNLIVRRFEPKHFVGGSIYADFLQAVGLEMTDEFQIEQSVRNERLAGNTHEIQRVLNAMPGMSGEYHSFFRQALLSYAELSGQIYPCEMFSKEEANAFMEKYRAENQEVADEFLEAESCLIRAGRIFRNGKKIIRICRTT